MKINTNTWNKIRYTLYTPGYDKIARLFGQSREKSIKSLDLKNGQKVLIIGAGTGLDLEFLPADIEIVATDITPAMIEKIKHRNKKLNLRVEALVMDGQQLSFDRASFDHIILHLILAVIPDPEACITEAERVLKPGGSIVVFDKFVRKNQKVSLLRRLISPIANLMFSDITRHFESILAKTQLVVVSDEEADLKGNFRRIKLKKM